MKKKFLLGGILLVTLVVLIASYAPAIAAPSEPEIFPSVVLSNTVVLMDSEQTVVISGAGFPPGQELDFIVAMPLYHSIAGDLGTPVTSELGTFTAKWTLGRYSRVAKPGVYPLEVSVKEEGTPAVVVPIVFVEKAK
ncbi:hypothetical protein ACFLTZ_06540 [Chloroflexota bacterium]